MGEHSYLASPAKTREVLEAHGISPRKSLGQNFLIDDNVIGKILELADLSRDDIVLEIGPGIGTLTCALLDSCAGVLAVERDTTLPAVLRETLSFQWDRLSLVQKDALDIEQVDLAYGSTETGRLFPTKLVSNLPYSVAATVVLDYFKKFESLDSMTVMVQKEVADRMQATPGSKDYGAYTIKLSMYADYVDSFNVAPSCFIPAPHVDSTVIKLKRKPSTVDAAIVDKACLLADAAFFARRKTIANSMKQFFSGRDEIDVATIPSILKAAGIDPSVRGETLWPETFISIAQSLSLYPIINQ